MSARDTARKVLGTVAAGAVGVAVAIGIVAQDEQRPPERVTEAVRTVRYVLYNESNGPPPGLCGADTPPDVECVAYGWTQEAEAARGRLLDGMGVSVSALPAVMVYAEEEVQDDAGTTTEVRRGWREFRVADLPKAEWKWRDGLPPTSRREPVHEWALKRSPPPPVMLDGGAP